MTVMEFITYLSCSDQAAVDGLTNACGSNQGGVDCEPWWNVLEHDREAVR